MKNEGIKQANVLANWFEANDITIDDVIVTIKLKNDDFYKVMSDGSIVVISNNLNGNKAFSNAADVITHIEGKKSTKDSIFKVKIIKKGNK